MTPAAVNETATATSLALARPNAFEPRSLAEAERLSNIYAMSGLCRFKNPDQIMLVLATARDNDIPYTTALRQMYITQGGTVGMESDLVVALVLRSPLCEYFRCVETTDKIATYETKRRGNPAQRYSFTIEQAQAAGLIRPNKDGSPGVWAKWTQDMLRHRASGKLADMEYPDVTGGMGSREIQDAMPPPPVSAATVVQKIQAAPAVAVGINATGLGPAPEAAWTSPVPTETLDAEPVDNGPGSLAWEARQEWNKRINEVDLTSFRALADEIKAAGLNDEYMPRLKARYAALKEVRA